MKRFLLSILFVVPWLISSAQDTTLEIGFESQEAFDSNWSQIGGEASWTWLNYQAGANSLVPVAQWQVVSPIPEKGTIIAYKQGLNMKAGTGKAGLYSRSDGYTVKAFEILVATDNQFNNIVATVQSSSKGTNFGMRPLGNQYQPNTFTINADGTYYVGFRCISQYDDEVTTEGTLMVKYLQVSFDKYEPPTPSACTDVAVISKSTETTLAADLSWTWPTTDTNGTALVDVGAYIYRSTIETDLITPENLVYTVECASHTGNGVYTDENISEPGTYYYAIVPFTSNSISSVNPQIVSVKIDYFDPYAPISLEQPYNNPLASEDDLKGFSIDPTGWQINANGYLYLNGPAAGTSVSSLKSPAFEMMDGVQYAVSFDAWVSSGTNHFIALKAGNSTEEMASVGEPANITASQAQPQRVQFVVTGNAQAKTYLEFVGTAMARASLYMDNITVEEYIPQPIISIDEINLDVTLQPTCVALSIAASDITKENLGDASIALYYKLSMSNDVVSEEEDAYTAMTEPSEDNANYTAEIPYTILKPGTSYMISIKANAIEADNIIAQDINDEAGEFTYSPTITINDLNVTDVTTESVDLNIQYATEYLPEDATITASISEDSWTKPQSFAISGNPATLSVNGLESGKEYTFLVTLQAGESDVIIYSDTKEIKIQTPGIFVDKINLDVTLQPTCVALSIAASDITKENLGDASIALYYMLTMSNDVVSEDERAYIAMKEMMPTTRLRYLMAHSNRVLYT